MEMNRMRQFELEVFAVIFGFELDRVMGMLERDIQ